MAVECKLKEWREKSQMSRLEVAYRAGVCMETVIRFEEGKVRKANGETYYKLAHVFGMSPADMIPSLALRPRSRGRTKIVRSDLPLDAEKSP